MSAIRARHETGPISPIGRHQMLQHYKQNPMKSDSGDDCQHPPKLNATTANNGTTGTNNGKQTTNTNDSANQYNRYGLPAPKMRRLHDVLLCGVAGAELSLFA